jgi:exonuclease III
MGLENVLIWNVCDLNARSRRDVVKQLVTAEKPSIACLQETKCVVLNDFDIMQLLGPSFDYFYLPMAQTQGGILIAWHSSFGRLQAPLPTPSRRWQECAIRRMTRSGG